MTDTVMTAERTRGGGLAHVDPRAPRFGQALTALGLGVGILLQLPVLIYAVAAVLLTAVLTRWRYDPYGILWRVLVAPTVEPNEPEPAAPHRFAKLMGAVGTGVASALLLLDVTIAGYVVAGVIAIPAGLGATTGFCLGCRMYKSVAFFRRLDVV